MNKNLKENVELQKEYLNKNIEQLNIVVSAILGKKVALQVKVEENRYLNKTYFYLVDDRNIRSLCGIMAKAFEKVTIENFGMWWQEDGVIFDLQFCYNHVGGGSNGAKFCTIEITNDFIKVR